MKIYNHGLNFFYLSGKQSQEKVRNNNYADIIETKSGQHQGKTSCQGRI